MSQVSRLRSIILVNHISYRHFSHIAVHCILGFHSLLAQSLSEAGLSEPPPPPSELDFMETSESLLSCFFFLVAVGLLAGFFFLSASSSVDESESSMNSLDLMFDCGTLVGPEDFFLEEEEPLLLDPPLFSALLAALDSFLARAMASLPPLSYHSLYSSSYRDLSAAAFFSHC